MAKSSKNSKILNLSKEETAKEKVARIKKFYEEELIRKDKIIDDLQKEKDILFKTVIRQAEKNTQLSSRLSQLIKNKSSPIENNSSKNTK